MDMLVHRIISNQPYKLTDFPSASLVYTPFLSALNVCRWHTAPSICAAPTTNSFIALLNLYHCSVLLGQKEIIERYHQELLERPEYDPSNTTIEKFIQLCQEALI